MKVAGEATLNAQDKEVWSALHDPALLARAIPGCEWLEVTGPGTARFSIRLDMAAVAGRYVGQVSVSDEQEPDRIALAVSASGDRGTGQAEIMISLAPAGGATTRVSYQVSGVVGGTIAAAGSRLLASVATRQAGEFLAAIDRRLTASAENTGAAGASGPLQAGKSAVASAAEAAARVPQAARPRIAAAFGAGVALGLGGVIVAAILGRRNGGRRAED